MSSPDDPTQSMKEEKPSSVKLWRKKVSGFLMKWHLPLFLLIALIIGYLWPNPGDKANDTEPRGLCFTLKGEDGDTCVYGSISNYLIGIIFLVSGLKLKTNEILDAVKEWKAALFGTLSILLISPLATFWFVVWNFKVAEFGLGLSIFFSQATTLSSGIIITGQAKGNVALALLLTVVTNILSVITMPLFVVKNVNTFVDKHYKGEDGEAAVKVEVNALPIIIQLLFLILIPLLLGKLLRYIKKVQSFLNYFPTTTKLLPSLFLAIIVWMNISNSADDLKEIDAKSVVLLFVAGFGIHFAMLIFNSVAVKYILRMPAKEERAVVICASQKTLPIALTVLELLDESVIGSKGLIAIPMIASHFSQIVIDAFLAAYWVGKPLEAVLDEDFDEPEDKASTNDDNEVDEGHHENGKAETTPEGADPTASTTTMTLT